MGGSMCCWALYLGTSPTVHPLVVSVIKWSRNVVGCRFGEHNYLVNISLHREALVTGFYILRIHLFAHCFIAYCLRCICLLQRSRLALGLAIVSFFAFLFFSLSSSRTKACSDVRDSPYFCFLKTLASLISFFRSANQPDIIDGSDNLLSLPQETVRISGRLVTDGTTWRLLAKSSINSVLSLLVLKYSWMT